MQFDFLEIILLLGAGQGILLAFAFIFSQDDRKKISKVFFAFILLITSSQLIIYTLSISGNIVEVPHLSIVHRPFMFLIGPLYFFYVKSLTEEHLKFRVWDVLHLVPFFLVLWYYIGYYLLPAETKISLFQNWTMGEPLSIQTWLYISFNLIVTFGYFLATFWLIRDEEKKLFDFISNNQILRKVSQLKIMTAGFSLYVFTFLITLILLFVFETYTFVIDYSWVLTKTLFIHALGFIAVTQPKVFSVTGDFKPSGSSLNGSKYEKSGLSDEQANAYFKKLIKLIEEEQPYLNSDLKLTTLAEEMSVSSNLLSQAINQNSEENFSGLINRYRIEHAKELLRRMDPSSDKTIFEIAMDSGFNTKSSFNRNFKEYTSQTPSSYRESVKLKETG